MKEMVEQLIAKIGENVAIRRFARFKVGEMDSVSQSAASETEAVPAI